MKSVLIATIACLIGCGARSGLEEHLSEAVAQDGGPSDVQFGDLSMEPRSPDGGLRDTWLTDVGPLIPPECGTVVPPGTVRGSVDNIHTRMAIDNDGNLYAGRRIEDTEWLLVSLDPCLRPRWEAPLTGIDTRRDLTVMVDARGDVWVASRRSSGVWRFDSSGEQLDPGLAFDPPLFTWVGIPDDAGPVFATAESTERKFLRRIDARGGERQVPLMSPSSFVWTGECLIAGPRVACHNVGYDRDSLEVLWVRTSPRIIDGTLRHILPPAADGRRMWTVRYGLSTYDLVAHDLDHGGELLATPVARTTRGQVDLLVGPPVVSGSGLVVIYFSGTRSQGGRLEAYTREGALHWAVAAARTRRGSRSGIYSGEATHVAGSGGYIYLAVGESVYGVQEATGEIAWSLSGLGDLNEPGTNLSPNGELYVRTFEGTVFAIPTDSPGPARSPWPVPGGTHRLNYASP